MVYRQHAPIPSNIHPVVTRAKDDISKHVSRLSLYTTTTSSIPRSHIHALRYLVWQKAMLDKYNALLTNETWVVVPRLANHVCLYMHDPREPHFYALKRILWYVLGVVAKRRFLLMMEEASDSNMYVWKFFWQKLSFEDMAKNPPKDGDVKRFPDRDRAGTGIGMGMGMGVGMRIWIECDTRMGMIKLPRMMTRSADRSTTAPRGRRMGRRTSRGGGRTGEKTGRELELELWCHAMVGAGHAAYTDRFHEPARLVPHLVTPKNKRIKRYIYRLALQTRRMVEATELTTIQSVILKSEVLTDKEIRNESWKKNSEKRGNGREPRHFARDCRKGTKTVNPLNARNPIAAYRACFECGGTDHYKATRPRSCKQWQPDTRKSILDGNMRSSQGPEHCDRVNAAEVIKTVRVKATYKIYKSFRKKIQDIIYDKNVLYMR
nr:reverse transcriptase domain-containing protein [Tanacetum cinerariifolium]